MRTLVEQPRRAEEAGVELTLMALSVSSLGLAAVDLASGAMVRTGGEHLRHLGLCPYDVISARLADEPEPYDPTQPEAVDLDGVPTLLRGLAPRRAERWLRPLLHPERVHLLGFAGPAIPFWQLDGSRPSMAVVPARATISAGDDGHLRCRFPWRTLLHDLPVAVGHSTNFLIEPSRVVVALTPPIEGHCYKVVTGLI